MDKNDRQNTVPGKNLAAEHELPVELRLIAQRYAAQPVPCPTPEATRNLMTRLLAEETVVERVNYQPRKSLVQSLHMARWHMLLLGPWFWILGALLLLLGFLIAPAFKAEAILMLVILLPLTALMSVVHALHRLRSGAREVEVSCPTSIVQVMVALVLAIVCFDALLGLIATVGVALAQWAPFVTLLTAWLGPLLLIVGISFPIALRWGTLPAVVIGSGPWLILIVLSFMLPNTGLSQSLWMPQDSFSIVAHFLAAGLGALILLLLFLRGSTWQRALVL